MKKPDHYFIRNFGDPNDVHFHPYSIENDVLAALRSLGATQPTTAVMTGAVIDQIYSAGFSHKPYEDGEAKIDLAGELGSWLEWKAAVGYQPYAAWAHPTAQKDPKGIEWSTKEWFVNLAGGK